MKLGKRTEFSLALKKILLPWYIILVYPVAKLLLDYKILDSVDTIKRIKKGKLSMSRYGDGEYEILRRKGTGFQSADDGLADKLEYILKNPINGHLICIPYAISSLKGFRSSSKAVWKSFICRNILVVLRSTSRELTYGNSLCTRFYMLLEDKSEAPHMASLLKSLWNGRKVCVIEGEGTRIGVGNDLLSQAIEVKRILCPSRNAFSKYNEIRNAVNDLVSKDMILLIALGMTATVLSYDLTIDGYQALDIGHIDVEYEWMKMGALDKCDLPGRTVNELGCNDVQQIIDEEYESQIIRRIYE